MRKSSILFTLFLFFAFYTLVSLLTPGAGRNEWVTTLLSFSSFIFAIILGFSTANRKQRLEQIRSRLRANDAYLLSIYESSKIYGKEISDGIRKKIDTALIVQLDYCLRDFEKTTPELVEFYQYILKIEVPKGKETEIKKKMVDDARQLLLNQKAIIYWIKDKMQSFEWLSLYTLGIIILFCIYYLRDGSLIAIMLVPVIASTLTLLGLVLKEFDTLEWQEHSWIWEPLSALFIELDLPPYFPEDIFDNGRVKKNILGKLKSYRMAHYKHPYPDMSDKVVELVKRS